MFDTIVWATDGSEAADEALPYAKELAAGEGRKLVVVHSKEVFVGRGGGYPVLADEQELVQKIRGQVAALLDEGIDASLQLASGAAPGSAHMIAELARDAHADVIVVGTRGHGALAGLLLGSVTQRLLHIAPCPVFAVPTGKHAEAVAAELETLAAN